MAQLLGLRISCGPLQWQGMQTALDRAPTLRFRPEFARLLAIFWLVGLALVYLVRYGAWTLPVQTVEVAFASLPTFHIGPHFGEFWMARVRDAACVFFIFFAALGVGATTVDRLIERRDVLGVLFAIAMGLWVLGVLTLIAGTMSVVKVPCVFLLMACWALRTPRKFIREMTLSREPMDGWEKLMIACLLIAAMLNLAGALAPPFEYDELEYHLGALADYQRAGHIVFLPHDFYSNMPQLTEMLYLLATMTSSDIAAKLMHWTFGVLGALVVYGVGQRLWSKSMGLTAAALFYCVPFVQDLGQTARIDLATAFFATLAFGAVVLWAKEEKWEMGWISALCAGAAAATKWPAIPIVLVPAVLVLISRRKFSLLPGFCCVAIAMIVPWLIKNWALAGNPVYPLLQTWFPNPHWSAAQAMMLTSKHSPTFNWSGFQESVTLLWKYSFTETGAVPFLLMTAPLLLLVQKPEPAAKRSGWLFVAAYVAWFCCTFRPWRFLFPAFGIAAVTAAYAAEELGRDIIIRNVWRLSVGVILFTSFAALSVNDLVDVENPERVPAQISFVTYDLGQFTRDEFVAGLGKGVLEPIVWMNENLPAYAKVLYVGEARAYYAKNSVVWSTAFDQHPLTAMSQEAKTSEGLLAMFRAQGITHVYVNVPELRRLQSHYGYMANTNWDLVDAALRQGAKVIHETGRGIVYELVS